MVKKKKMTFHFESVSVRNLKKRFIIWLLLPALAESVTVLLSTLPPGPSLDRTGATLKNKDLQQWYSLSLCLRWNPQTLRPLHGTPDSRIVTVVGPFQVGNVLMGFITFLCRKCQLFYPNISISFV